MPVAPPQGSEVWPVPCSVHRGRRLQVDGKPPDLAGRTALRADPGTLSTVLI